MNTPSIVSVSLPAPGYRGRSQQQRAEGEAQAADVLRYGPVGPIAQLVELRTFNPPR